MFSIRFLLIPTTLDRKYPFIIIFLKKEGFNKLTAFGYIVKFFLAVRTYFVRIGDRANVCIWMPHGTKSFLSRE